MNLNLLSSKPHMCHMLKTFKKAIELLLHLKINFTFGKFSKKEPNVYDEGKKY